MADSLVSVVIPTYNRAYCLETTLRSVFEQTHQDFEILLVDDGSTDDTGDLIRRLYPDEPRLRYLPKPNGGVASARNYGLQRIRGDFVALLDSDDLWKPWKLEVQLACLNQFPKAGMIWTDMEALDPQGRVVDPRYLRKMYRAYRWFPPEKLFQASAKLVDFIVPPPGLESARCYYGDIFSQMFMGNLVHTSTVLLRRERFEQVRAFNEELAFSGEDFDFHLRTCRAGPVLFLDAATIGYQTGMPDRLTRPEYGLHMACNALSTVAPVLANDRDRIQLPAQMIRDRMAELHRWVGASALDLGDHSTARSHLTATLRYRPSQPAAAALLALSLLPPSWANTLRNSVRRLRRRRPSNPT